MTAELKRDFDIVRSLYYSHPDNRILFALRHGESMGQIDVAAYRTFGDTGIPLTPRGSAQAVAAGHILGWIGNTAKLDSLRIFSSTGRRASHTAREMERMMSRFLPVSLELDTRLDKQKFGLFDGLFTTAERKKTQPKEYAAYLADVQKHGEFYARPPQGESISDVQNRIADSLKDIFQQASPTVIVTHGLNVLCIENILMHRGKEWVLRGQDTKGNCAIQLFSGNEEDGFDELTVCDDPLAWEQTFGQKRRCRPA